MLKFKKVEAQNYKTFGKVTLDLEEQGLTLIEGFNNDSDGFDSNASGKSSLLEMITYALYDTTANKLKADEVVSRKHGKDTFVKLFFEQNKVSYRIERYRKHKEHKNKVKLYQSGKEITGATNKTTNEMIREIIGISIDTYLNSIMYGQSSEPLFTEATDKGKKEILENITSISVYAKAQEVAKEKVKEKDLKASEIVMEQETVSNKLQSIQEFVEREKENYKSVQNMVESRKEGLKEAKDNLKEFPKGSLTKLKKDLEAMSSPLGSFHGDTTVIDSTKQELQDIQQKAQEFQQAINQLTAQVNHKVSEQGRLDTTDVCPTCGSPMSNEHAKEHHQELQQEIDQTQVTINTYNEQYTQVFEPLIAQAEEKLRQSEVDFEAKKQEHNDKKHQQELAIQQIKSQIVTFENNLTQLEAEVDRAKDSLEEVNALPKPDERKDEIEGLEKNLEEIKTLEGEVFLSKARYEDAVKAFSNQGIRSVVLDLVTPTLTNSANKYLATLSDSVLQVEFRTQVEKQDGTLSDKFDVLVINGGEEASFQTLSQGEKTRVNVAISLALQDLVYSNSQLQTNIALYDEVFDGLDDKGVSSVIEILEDKAEEIGSVFVITHSNIMKPLFENVLTITKENGTSTIGES